MLETLTPPNFPSEPLDQRQSGENSLPLRKTEEKEFFLAWFSPGMAGLSPSWGEHREGLWDGGGWGERISCGSRGTIAMYPPRIRIVGRED